MTTLKRLHPTCQAHSGPKMHLVCSFRLLVIQLNFCLFSQIVSPRNHMVFTPLLASTCVGTLEPRSVALPLIDIQKELKQPQVGVHNAFRTRFAAHMHMQCNLRQVTPTGVMVHCRTNTTPQTPLQFPTLTKR